MRVGPPIRRTKFQNKIISVAQMQVQSFSLLCRPPWDCYIDSLPRPFAIMSSPIRPKDSAERFYAFSGSVLFRNSDLSPKPGVLTLQNVRERPSVVEVSSTVNQEKLCDLLSVPKRRSASVPPQRSFDKSGHIARSPPERSPGASRSRTRRGVNAAAAA